MLRIVIGSAILVLAGAAASAATLSVKNCTSEMVAVVPWDAEGLTSGSPAGPETSISPSGIGTLSCNTSQCRLEVKFHTGALPGWQYYTYDSDRCVKSLTELQLEGIGSCGC